MSPKILDEHLTRPRTYVDYHGAVRFLLKFWYFGIKQARACLFVVLFFTAVFAAPRAGLFGIARYDLLLITALLIQAWMVWSGLKTLDELKAISLFHAVGFALEAFKTSSDFSSGWRKISARFLVYGSIPTRWARGRRCMSASGVRGRCW